MCYVWVVIECKMTDNKHLKIIRDILGITYVISVRSCPTTHHAGADGEDYSSYSLDGGEWPASRPGRALPPGKGPSVSIVQEVGWAPEPVWTQRLEEKSLCHCRRSNLDRPIVQPVTRHYTDWATRLTEDDGRRNKNVSWRHATY
jgi:hypothetical protein